MAAVLQMMLKALCIWFLLIFYLTVGSKPTTAHCCIEWQHGITRQSFNPFWSIQLQARSTEDPKTRYCLVVISIVVTESAHQLCFDV